MPDDDAPPPSAPAPEPAPGTTTITTDDADATPGATTSNDDDAPVLHRAESSPLPSQHYYNRNVRDEQLALDAARARPTSSLPAWARLGRRNNTAPMPGAGGHRASAATLSESDLASAIPDRDWLAAALPDPIPAAPTDPAAAGAPVVALTVDRVVTASALEDHLLVLHQLLHRTRHPDPRTDALYLVRAENRYVKWLFMAERLRAAGDESLLVSGRLLPPVDVAMMWLAHLTAVRHYTEDIARLFDDALLHVPPPLAKLRDRLELHAHDYEDRASSAMWEAFTGESYTLRFDDESPFYLSCPTCTASVRVECHDYVLLKTDPSFRGIVCDGGAAAATEASASNNAAPPVIVPGGCGTVLTSGFLSAVRFVNDFKGSLREENVFLAGTLLNPVSGKPNHYLSKQIVQYLAQAPSVAELYSAVLVPLPSPPPSPSVEGTSATTAPGPASSVQAVLDGSTVSTTSGGSATATDPAAGTAPSSRRASMAASGPSSSLAARRASWATATPVAAPPPQNLDPWREISNVLFRLEVDLYALEIEDHRLISYHIRAAIERMERCYRDLVTPLSLDLVERVRGYWRVHAGLLVAWTVHAAATLPPALPRDEDEEDDETTVLARDVLSADEADDGDEVAPRTLGRRTRGRARSRVLTAPTIDVAQAILDVLPQGMVAIRPAKNGGYVLTFDTPPPVHAAADTPTMPTAFPTQDAPATNADAPPPVPLMMPPRAPPAHRGATAVAYKLVPAARAAAASTTSTASRRSRSVPALRRALSSASTLDVIPESPLRGINASDAPLASPTTADAPVDDETAAAAEDPNNDDDEAYVHPPPGDPWDTGRPGIDSAVASSPILHRALSSPSLLAQCTIRYHKMLLLQQRHAGLYASRLALAADMTLCHWTHLLHPPRYIRFCGAHYGRLITYEFASAQAMHAALVNTARRWERRYREPLDAGVVPKLSLADKLAALVDRVVGKLVSTGPI